MKLKMIFFVLLSVFCFSLQAQETPCGEGVEGHIHPNGRGFVANTATIDDDSYVGLDSAVCDDSEVFDSKIAESSSISKSSKISRSKIYDSEVDNSEVSGSTFNDSTISHATVDDLRGSRCHIDRKSEKCRKRFEKYEYIPFDDQAQVSQINPFEMFSCSSGYDLVEMNEEPIGDGFIGMTEASIIQCRPTCETAAKLAGYSEWTLYRDRSYYKFDDGSNTTISTCERLNDWDGSHWWGRQGEGYNGHRDWKSFEFVNSSTGPIQDNHSVSEVINWRTRSYRANYHYSVCCVRGNN